MTARTKYLTLGLAVVLIVVPSVFYFMSVGRTHDALESRLREIGFYPIKPPSTLVGPGSIYHVTRDGRFYTTVCRADQSAIRDFVQKSPSEQMIERQLQNSHYSLDTNLAKVVNAALGSDVVESISYTLSNVTVMEIPLDRNEHILVQLTSDEDCKTVVDRLLAANEFVCQGQSALIASVELNLNTRTGSRYQAKMDEEVVNVKQALEASLNDKIEVSSGRLLSGVDLHYGVKVAPTCIAPKGARFARRLPQDWWNRFTNFVKLDLLGG